MARFPLSKAPLVLARTRALALLALVLSLLLVSLHLGEVLAPSVASSPRAEIGVEADPAPSAERLLATLAGPGAVRVMIHGDRDGTRSILVLLDTRVPATERLDRATLADLLSAAGRFAPEAGDRLNVLRAPFATPRSDAPGLGAILELAGLALLASLALAWCVAAWLAVEAPEAASARPGRDGTDIRPASAGASSDRGPAYGGQLRPELVQRGRDTLRADPAKAAGILRSWIAAPRRAI